MNVIRLKLKLSEVRCCVWIVVIFILLLVTLFYRYYTSLPSELNQKWTNMYRLGFGKMVNDASYIVGKVKGIEKVDANRLVRGYLIPNMMKLPDWIKDYDFDGVPVRMYNPLHNISGSSMDKERAIPAIIYIHGGGWVAGSIEQYHSHVKRFSQDINTFVFSVDYRLAPQHVFPAGFDDTVTAVKHLMTNATFWNIDPNRITVMGDSSGANLAAALNLYWRDHHKDWKLPALQAQILIYPPLQAINFNTPSYIQNGRRDLVLTQLTMAEFWAYYVQGSITDVTHYLLHQHVTPEVAKKYQKVLNMSIFPEDFYSSNFHLVEYTSTDYELAQKLEPVLTDYRFAPLMAENFSGLPPTYILSCFFDVLRDDGVWFALQLKKAGVKVKLNQAKAAYHGMFWRLYLDDGMAIYEDALKFMANHL